MRVPRHHKSRNTRLKERRREGRSQPLHFSTYEGDDLLADDTDPYLEVARRFFNEFIEMKISLDKEGVITVRAQEKERAKYQKELKKWEDANEVLKRTAQALVKDNDRLEEEVGRLEEEVAELRREINEQLMRQTDVVRKLHDYPLDQLMTKEAHTTWLEELRILKQLMEETPTRKGE